MHWSDEAILLSVRKHGESSAVVKALTPLHGLYGGVVRGVHSKANRGVIQPGNGVNVTWNARLSEQLGSFRIELVKANAALIMQDAARLAALMSACAMMEAALPERHPYPKLYAIGKAFFDQLADNPDWAVHYVTLELAILAESGFGLDLSECAGTGSKENLIYVSPKSGRAVSAEAGEPYKEKLLKLPDFLLTSFPTLSPLGRGDASSPSPAPAGEGRGEGIAHTEILAGLRLTGYFLEHWLLEPHRRKMPAARERLMDAIYRNA